MKFTFAIPIVKPNYLIETFESVINQSYKDYDVIIRNNAKNPQTKEKIKSISRQYISNYNFKYYESDFQEDISTNFNEILKKIDSEFFIFLSDDDTINKNFLSEFEKIIKKYKGIDLFHCRVLLKDENGNTTSISPLCPEFETHQDFIFHRISGKRIMFLSDFVVRTRKFKEIGGFDNLKSGWGIDDMAWFKLSKKGVGYTKYCGLNYRQSPHNLTSSTETISLKLRDNLILNSFLNKYLDDKLFFLKSDYNKEMFSQKLELHKNKADEFLLSKVYLSKGFFYFLFFYFSNKEKFGLNLRNLLMSILISKKVKL